jgi:hypothetical protein
MRNGVQCAMRTPSLARAANVTRVEAVKQRAPGYLRTLGAEVAFMWLLVR